MSPIPRSSRRPSQFSFISYASVRLFFLTPTPVSFRSIILTIFSSRLQIISGFTYHCIFLYGTYCIATIPSILPVLYCLIPLSVCVVYDLSHELRCANCVDVYDIDVSLSRDWCNENCVYLLSLYIVCIDIHPRIVWPFVLLCYSAANYETVGKGPGIDFDYLTVSPERVIETVVAKKTLICRISYRQIIKCLNLQEHLPFGTQKYTSLILTLFIPWYYVLCCLNYIVR